MKDKIENLIRNALPEGLKDSKIEIEYPPKNIYGDYTTNLPLSIAANDPSKKPLEVARLVVENIEKNTEKIVFRKNRSKSQDLLIFSFPKR